MNGNPSIESLVLQNGTSWLKSDSDRAFYNNRKYLYDYIMNTVNDGYPEVGVVQELEKIRVQRGWSLSNLQTKISHLPGYKTSQAPPTYVLLRHLYTVPQVWQEYKYGVNGNPSVESLVQQFGTGWLKTNTEGKYYKGRKRIYEYISNEIANGKSEQDAVQDLEEFRNSKKWTIAALQANVGLRKSEAQRPMYEDEYTPNNVGWGVESGEDSLMNDDDESLYAEIVKSLQS